VSAWRQKCSPFGEKWSWRSLSLVLCQDTSRQAWFATSMSLLFLFFFDRLLIIEFNTSKNGGIICIYIPVHLDCYGYENRWRYSYKYWCFRKTWTSIPIEGNSLKLASQCALSYRMVAEQVRPKDINQLINYSRTRSDAARTSKALNGISQFLKYALSRHAD